MGMKGREVQTPCVGDSGNLTRRLDTCASLPSPTSIFDVGELYANAFNARRPHNHGKFCDHKHHPNSYLGYRRYRRGKNRCLYCGAKIGEPELRWYTLRERLLETIFTLTPFFKEKK